MHFLQPAQRAIHRISMHWMQPTMVVGGKTGDASDSDDSSTTTSGEAGDSSIAKDDTLDGAAEDASDDVFVDSSEELSYERGAEEIAGATDVFKGTSGAEGASNGASKGEFALCNEIGDSGLIVKLLFEEPEEESDELEDVDILSIVYKYLVP